MKSYFEGDKNVIIFKPIYKRQRFEKTNVVADRMELKENMLFVYDGPELVAMADISVILSARISDGGSRIDA